MLEISLSIPRRKNVKFWPFYFQFQAKYSDSTLNIKNLDKSKFTVYKRTVPQPDIASKFQ